MLLLYHCAQHGFVTRKRRHARCAASWRVEYARTKRVVAALERAFRDDGTGTWRRWRPPVGLRARICGWHESTGVLGETD